MRKGSFLQERPEACCLSLLSLLRMVKGLKQDPVCRCRLLLPREDSDGKEASFDLGGNHGATNLSGVSEGCLVNLERSLPANGLNRTFCDRHVDAQGKSRCLRNREKSLLKSSPLRLLSVSRGQGMHAVDGCSLTVVASRRVFCHLADTSYLDQDKLDGTQTR